MDTFTIRFRSLLPMTGDAPVENGQLVVEHGRIREVHSDRSCPVEGTLIDLADCLLMPGFVNAHCHLSLSVFRHRVPKREHFTDWVRALFQENEMVDWNDRVGMLHLGAREMLRSGVTALGDYMPQAELLTEYATLPFRQVLFLETVGFNHADADSIIKGVESVLRNPPDAGGDFTLGLAPHAPYSVSPALLRAMKKLSESYGCPISCHVAEFPEESRFLKEGGGEMQEFLAERGVYDETWNPPGMSPVRYLDSLGALESLIAVHLNLAQADIDLLASNDVKAVFCPKSTRWFGRTRFMPVREFIDRGLTVALGTDSLASNDSLNFLNELRAADEMLPGVSQGELVHMATRGGAEALGMDCGVVAGGRPADLIGFRVNGPQEDWTRVPFEPGRSEADFVMVNGKQVF